MLKRFLVASFAVALMASVSPAAVMLGYGVDATSGDLIKDITIDLNDPPADIPLYIEVNQDWNPSADFIGAMRFDFDSADGFMEAANPTGFEWLPAEFTQDCLGLPCWESTNNLPAPEAVWGGPFGLIISSPGQAVQWGRLSIDPTAPWGNPDDPSNPSGFEVYDLVGNPWEIKNKGTITIVPEPATVALLLIGGLTALRRRR